MGDEPRVARIGQFRREVLDQRIPPPKAQGGSLQAAERAGAAFFHSQGSSSSSRFAGCSAMRASTSASHACGSTSFIFAEVIRLMIVAALWPLPRDKQDETGASIRMRIAVGL